MIFPAACHGAAEQLVRAFLVKDPQLRLPMRPGKTDNIKKHPWYTQASPPFDWQAMFNLTLPPPYKPAVRSKTDIANFCARKEDMPKQFEYRDTGTGWDRDFATVTS